jgi:glycosyltransferase involved in cell wall biosynthesis
VPILDRSKIAIVIPAYNESNTIGNIIQSVSGHGTVIVVDDGSTDNTFNESQKCGAIVVRHANNLGYDQALNSGFKEAKKLNFPFVITFDADGQHVASVLDIYTDCLLYKGFDLVLGRRKKSARLSEWVFKLYSKYKFGWSDPLCGMKGYNMKIYNKMGVFDSISSIGTELATYGISNGYSYVEVDIPILERFDNPRFYSTFRSNILILRAMIRVMKKY